MSGFAVTPDDVDQAGNNATSANDNIEQILTQLRSQVDALQSVWSGVAHENFDGLYQEWNSGAKQLQDALIQIAAKLHQAANSYRETESSVSSTFH
ncbi:MAG: WXG100 family type VII secretion target [Candidatus Dormibacteria bacterium]